MINNEPQFFHPLSPVMRFLCVSGIRKCMDIHDDKNLGFYGHGKELEIYFVAFFRKS
jgi:hypothetical protein